MAERRDPSRGRVVSLLTDFGTTDGYVGAMKGVILGLNSKVTLVDITHEVAPQDVWGGAFVLHTAHRYFPPGTIHLAVVDPGVGTERAAVVLDTGRALFLAPDNGLLSFVLAEGRGDGDPSQPSAGSPQSLHEVQLPDGWRAIRIAESRYWLPNPSTTFHGRDIFAPVAAHLSLGEPLEGFGPRMAVLHAFSIPVARMLPGGGVLGAVIHVDRFGNLVTNLRAEDLRSNTIVTEVAGHRIQGLSRNYAGGAGLVVLVGSSGYLEIALPGGSAWEEIGKGVGAPVQVMPGV